MSANIRAMMTTTNGIQRTNARQANDHQMASERLNVGSMSSMRKSPLYRTSPRHYARVISLRVTTKGQPMDQDLAMMSRDQLIAEVKKLRAGIRAHRDSTGHDLCWHHPALWRLLPEKTDALPIVPTWPEFLRGCVRYRESLDEQLPDAPRSDAPYQT